MRDIVADLKFLSTTLAEIAQHEHRHGNNGSITDSLESYTSWSSPSSQEWWKASARFADSDDMIGTKQIQPMLLVTTKLELGLQSKSSRKRKWSAIKAVFKEDKIETCQKTSFEG